MEDDRDGEYQRYVPTVPAADLVAQLSAMFDGVPHATLVHSLQASDCNLERAANNLLNMGDTIAATAHTQAAPAAPAAAAAAAASESAAAAGGGRGAEASCGGGRRGGEEEARIRVV